MIKSCSINPDSNFSSQPKPVPQHSEFDDGRTVVQYSIEVSICTVRYPSWMSTENTLTIPFCYYKSHIYTHFLYWNRSPRSPVVVVTQFHSVHPSRRRFDQFASHPFWSCPTHEKHPQFTHTPTFTSIFSSCTFSSWLTKSIPVHDPHLNHPPPTVPRILSVPISDNR